MAHEYNPNHIAKKDYALVGQKAIISKEDNTFLIVQRSDKLSNSGKWDLPGGALDKGEDPFVGMLREIFEETELSVTNLKLFSLRSFTYKEDFMVMVGYTATCTSPKVVLSWEYSTYRWINKADALLLDLTDNARFFIEKI